MNAKKAWSYEEISKVLSDTRPATEVAEDLGTRSAKAIVLVRAEAGRFQKGHIGHWVSKPLREGFQRYFANKGNMQFEEQKATEVAEIELPEITGETYEEKVEALTNEIEQVFEGLKDLLAKYADVVVAHQTHMIVSRSKDVAQELGELRTWKREHEEELNKLREFQRRAHESNIGKMLRRIGQPRQAIA